MTVACPKCGAGVSLPGTRPFASCAHCDSALWIDFGALLLHTTVNPAIDEGAARRLVRGARPRAVAGLVWRPFWLYTRGTVARMAPADSLLRTELDECPALSGEERAFEGGSRAAAGAVPPNIPLAAVLDESERASARPRLVHVPFWEIAGVTGTVLIDAVEGRLQLSPTETTVPPVRSFAGPATAVTAGAFAAQLLLAQSAAWFATGLVALIAFWYVARKSL